MNSCDDVPPNRKENGISCTCFIRSIGFDPGVAAWETEMPVKQNKTRIAEANCLPIIPISHEHNSSGPRSMIHLEAQDVNNNVNMHRHLGASPDLSFWVFVVCRTMGAPS